jgi:hypothetical protein
MNATERREEVRRLLADPKTVHLPNAVISRLVGSSRGMVANLRREKAEWRADRDLAKRQKAAAKAEKEAPLDAEIARLLSDPENVKRSPGEIARIVGVPPNRVNKIRRGMTPKEPN